MTEEAPRLCRGTYGVKHDLAMVGREKNGGCSACFKIRDKKRQPAKRQRKKYGGEVAPAFPTGTGYIASDSDGFMWQHETVETPGRLKAILTYNLKQPGFRRSRNYVWFEWSLLYIQTYGLSAYIEYVLERRDLGYFVRAEINPLRAWWDESIPVWIEAQDGSVKGDWHLVEATGEVYAT